MTQRDERPSSIPSFGAFWAGLLLILLMVMVIRKAKPNYNKETVVTHTEEAVSE